MPNPMPTSVPDDDLALVRGMAAGDERCLAGLYDRHAGLLMAIGQNLLRNAVDTEDVIHDVFLEAWRRATSFDPARGSVRGWLVVKMRSRCLDRLRALATRRDLHPDDAPQPTPTPLDTFGAGADHARLHRALQALPASQREVIDLVYFRGLSSQQAADALACPAGTVKSRVRLAMQTLRAALAPQEVA